MNRKELIEKIEEKKEFSMLPEKDVESAFDKFDNDRYSDEEKVKLTRDLLRKTFSGFSGKKLLVSRDKEADEILKKHLSTRERYPYYQEIYERVLKNLPKKISIIDLGAGVNGLSYEYFSKVGKKVAYTGVEAVGQLAETVKNYFEKQKIEGKSMHASLFETERMKKIIEEEEKPRVLFIFKVIDSLEKIERDYTKKLLKEIVPVSDRVVVSFATESWMRRKKFFANRKWLIDFIGENWSFIDDFNLGGERYLVFENK